MKVCMWYNDECDAWFEDNDVGYAHREPIELPDAIIAEWRELTKRLEEINAYFNDKIPPLQREADAKLPPKPLDPVAQKWAALMLKQYMADPCFWRDGLPKKDPPA